VHGYCRADAGEGERHHRNQRPVVVLRSIATD
jgi:hypothetical protein